jgi:hypothetical protein
MAALPYSETNLTPRARRTAPSGETLIATPPPAAEDIVRLVVPEDFMAFFNTFKNGDVVPTSGSYTALHSTPHKLLERAVHVEGERFESCKLCPLGVLYRLEQPGVQTPLLANLGHEALALC